MSAFKRFTRWLKSFTESPMAHTLEPASPQAMNSAWHGDHWQNLLSSPMDARRYVMEDWATPLDNDRVPANDRPARAEAA